ncbi:hypothetical protein TWF694_003391 [Orbilia ellipsospora]|uniref:BTB domain-containing protein n=1 Tax=Orbilia ellipsospora TaxID=2528407 RepID=A0AAV9WZE2_9PEZI
MDKKRSTAQQEPGKALFRLQQNAKFSDFTVFVGPENQEFKLHRIILASRSHFFETAMDDKYQEGVTGKLALPEIDANIFQVIIEWMYNDSFTQKSHSWGEISEIYKTADYLQMPHLKTEISTQIAENTRNILCQDRSDGRGKSPLSEEDSLQLIFNVASVFSNSGVYDWVNVQRCTDALATEIFFSKEIMQEFVAKFPDTSVFLATLSVSLSQEISPYRNDGSRFTRTKPFPLGYPDKGAGIIYV